MQDAGHRNETLMTFLMAITYKLQSRAINRGKNQQIQKLQHKESRVRKNKEYQYRVYSSMRTHADYNIKEDGDNIYVTYKGES